LQPSHPLRHKIARIYLAYALSLAFFAHAV
jgi:hypothetical protein